MINKVSDISLQNFSRIIIYKIKDMESEKSDPITENIVNGVKRSLDNSSKDQSPIEQSASDVKSLERGIREDMVMNLIFMKIL